MDNFMFQKFMKAKKEGLKDDEVLSEEDNDSLDEVLEDESVEDNDDKKREEKGYVAKKNKD